MLLVVPLSRSDKNLAENAKKAFDLFSPGGGHSLLVVGSPNVTSELHDLSSSLSRHFNETNIHIFDNDSFYGWPSACNYYFLQACYHMVGSGVPWLWYELDCTPVKENWLSAIHQEYGPGADFMGCLERSYVGFNGTLLEADDAGNQMAACGVYPGDITGTVVPLRGIADTDRPWWHHIRWYVAPFARHTKLIQNNYKTENYRYNTENYKDGTTVICDSCNNTAWGNHYNNPISPEAVLVHGCKDGSLLDYLVPRIKCAAPADIVEKSMDILKEMSQPLDEPVKLFTVSPKPKPRSYRRKRKKGLGSASV